MGYLIGVGLLLLLVKLLNSEAGSVKTCTVIYFIARFLFGLLFSSLVFGNSILVVIIVSIISSFLAYGYFTLLERTGGLIWWIIFLVGAFTLFI